jgi:hypothetical protein
VKVSCPWFGHTRGSAENTSTLYYTNMLIPGGNTEDNQTYLDGHKRKPVLLGRYSAETARNITQKAEL